MKTADILKTAMNELEEKIGVLLDDFYREHGGKICCDAISCVDENFVNIKIEV